DDGFNEMDAYGEWYSNFSLGKLSGNDLAIGPIADFGLFMGAALGTDANFRQWLPGARVAWNLPGFIFLNTDLALGIDGGRGLAGGSPPELDNRFILDVNGLYLFSIGGQSFSITGHAEYAAATSNELGNDVPSSILAQPQFRWNIGGGNVHIGIEYQYWSNKLGTEVTESIVQWLGVWAF
ncbi:MAG: nucleoside-binding protein, partial [Gemmatimonadetes bacterium]|nr:nucleoside-binding protein [Gemmatimonadota bacterium]